MSLEHDETDQISVADEMALVERYLDLQRLRFGERLQATVEVDTDVATALVPSFVVQTLVENAIRHGIERRHGAGRVEVIVRRLDDEVALVVRDDGPGFAGPQGGGGLGLANLADRLVALYDGRARMSVGNRPGGGAEVSVRLPLEEDAPASEPARGALAGSDAAR
jgi:two-component system sensor histidine kinase AlgZ